MKLLAATKDLGVLEGIGPLGGEGQDFTDKEDALLRFNDYITLVVTLMTVISFIWFIVQLMTAAGAWLASGGDKQKLQEAQKKITHSILGITVIISAIFLIKLVEIILGIQILGFYKIVNAL